MALYKEGLDKVIDTEVELTAANGHSMKAVKVFSHAIHYLKMEALKVITETTGVEFKGEEVQWVLTVPAIWGQASKQFMREAAYQANVASRDHDKQLIIALEPEAASLHCIESPMAGFVNGKEHGVKCSDVVARPGTSYMIVDCGGGTVDITMHRITSDKKLMEIHKATGGPFGGAQVDEEFEKLLKKIFGEKFILDYKNEYPPDWLRIIMEFEMKKTLDRISKGNDSRIRLPYTFTEFHTKQLKTSMAKSIEKCYPEGKVKINKEYLVLNSEIMKTLFKPAIGGIVKLMGELLSKKELEEVKCIFLVGGFSESLLLQAEINKQFSKYKILVPRDANLAVVKGAILFGQNPHRIQMRISKLTYGCEICSVFDPSKHDPDRTFKTEDGDLYAEGLFHRLVKVNEKIWLGKTIKYTFQPIHGDQSEFEFLFYVTEKDDALYIDDDHVRKEETKIVVKSPHVSMGKNRDIDLKIEFADTEIRATAIDTVSGEVTMTHLELEAR
uniref:Heat shock 70 kDa protein 12A-like n=1 Tax=Saccoglossus kowalevskii TaxID=10224 RepID=A0ABM0GRX0_SACKO|nr:PREDICTED: heat shock 70 kDa protein 12A-like [Saccoglossus kowalevskii]